MKKRAALFLALALVGTLPALPALPGTAMQAAPDTWDAPIDISDPGENAVSQRVVTDGTTITAIWYRFDGSFGRIQSASSLDAGVTWSVPVDVSDAGQEASAPQLVTDGTTITAIWARFDGASSRIQSSFSIDAGVSWSVPVTVSDAGEDGFEPQLVTGGTTLTAVWQRFNGSTYQVQSASSGDAGVSWSVPVRVSEAGQDSYEPQLATDGNTITAIWYRPNGSDFRIQTATSADAGVSWSAPVTVSVVGQGAGNQHVVTDGTTITAVWYRYDGSFDGVQSASSVDAGVSWSAPATLSEPGQSAGSPQLATDGTTITAIWQRFDGSTFRIQSASSRDAGVSWSVPETMSHAGEDAFEPQLVTDGATLTAVWYRFDGSTYEVQSASSTDTGVSWSEPATLSRAGEDGFEPFIATDGNTVTAVWYRFDGTSYFIQASSLRVAATEPALANPWSLACVVLAILVLVILIGGVTLFALRSRRRRHAASIAASTAASASGDSPGTT